MIKNDICIRLPIILYKIKMQIITLQIVKLYCGNHVTCLEEYIFIVILEFKKIGKNRMENNLFKKIAPFKISKTRNVRKNVVLFYFMSVINALHVLPWC